MIHTHISTLSTESAMQKGQEEGQEGNIWILIWLHPPRYFIPDLEVLEIVTYWILLICLDIRGWNPPALIGMCLFLLRSPSVSQFFGGLESHWNSKVPLPAMGIFGIQTQSEVLVEIQWRAWVKVEGPVSGQFAALRDILSQRHGGWSVTVSWGFPSTGVALLMNV